MLAAEPGGSDDMRIGIYTDLRNPPAWRRPWAAFYAAALERVVEAERLGVGSVWVTEHHGFEDGYLPQPLTFLAAVAARTERVRLGTAVLLAPLRPALQIAEEAALVDLLSDGRLELGLGAGYRAAEYAAYGADVSRRFALLEERAREVRRLWDDGVCTPPPVQARPPIWLGVMGPRGARMAGRLGEGLGWLDHALLAPYRAGLAEGGHDPAGARMSGLANLIVADDPDAARARIKPHLAYQAESYRRYANPPDAAPAVRALRSDAPAGPGDGRRHALPPRLQVLAADDAIALLTEWLHDLPVQDVYLWASIAGMPDDLADRHVELVATRLAPALAGVGRGAQAAATPGPGSQRPSTGV
jgi:alkanesulfonate monooxygenase SsuD/methylene tetrahydromethanopterin reductase-like flavin-dependent oxidoreductase (luciferase family)